MPPRSVTRAPRARRLALLLPLCGLAAGCGLLHHGPPMPPPILILQPPLIFPAPPPAPMPPPFLLAPAPAPALAALLVPDLPFGPPPRRDAYRAGPAFQPKPAATPPSPPPPPLTAGLDPQQQAYYRRQAAATLQQANAVLQRLQARRLGPAAAATRAQANEYVRQAQQALALGDVVRAQTLADKAVTLARFLAGQ